jgi:hypothetical protein
MLVDHSNARRNRLRWRPETNRLAIYEDNSLIRAIGAGKDIHQGCLPSAILAKQSVDLSGAQPEVDPLIGYDPREALPYIAHLDRH